MSKSQPGIAQKIHKFFLSENCQGLVINVPEFEEAYWLLKDAANVIDALTGKELVSEDQRQAILSIRPNDRDT